MVPVSRWLELEGGGQAATRGLLFMLQKALNENRITDYFGIHEDTGRIVCALNRQHAKEFSGDQWTLLSRAEGQIATGKKQKQQKTIDNSSSSEGKAAAGGAARVAVLGKGAGNGRGARVCVGKQAEGEPEVSKESTDGGESGGQKPPEGKTPEGPERGEGKEKPDGKRRRKADQKPPTRDGGSPKGADGDRWKELGNIKKQLCSSVSVGFTVYRRISTDTSLGFMKMVPEFALMEKELQSLENIIESCAFWKCVFHSDTLGDIKKKHDTTTLAEQLAAKSKTVSKLCDDIVNKATVLKSMLAARGV